jgi:hypothetical protein
MEIRKNRVMEINDLISQFQNVDFDGDSEIAASLQSEEAKRDFNYMFIKNLIEFDHKDELLVAYEHESIYGGYMISKKAKEERDKLLNNPEFMENLDIIETVEELNGSISADNFIRLNKTFKHGGYLIKIKDEDNEYIYSLFEILVNKILGIFKDFDDLKEILNNFIFTFDKYESFKKNILNKFTYDYYLYLKSINKGNQFWDRIHVWNKFLLEASTRLSYAIPTFDFSDYVVKDKSIDDYRNTLIQNEPFLAFHQNLILFEDKIMPKINESDTSILNTLFNSKARLNSVQLLKAASNTGIPTDIYGKAMPINIKNALLNGLSKEEYYLTGDSARLALSQRQDSIPKGGELQRKFFFATGILKQNKEVHDCFEHTGKEKYFKIKIKNEKYLKVLKHRWYKLPDESNDKERLLTGEETDLIGKEIYFRTPVTCQLENYQVCQKCLGTKIPETTNLGAPIGQYLSEAIIQSVLRSHHFGGVFLCKVDNKIEEILRRVEIDASSENTVIRGSKSDIKYIENYLYSRYDNDPHSEGKVKIIPKEIDDELNEIYIEVLSFPKSEDAVKILTNITSLIDKNRDKKNIVPIEDIFNELINVSYENGIFNIYFELVLSLLFYDEENVLYRYSKTNEIVTQLSLKEIINNIDPKLSIFYNFSNKNLKSIYSKKDTFKVDHMYRDLIALYK